MPLQVQSQLHPTEHHQLHPDLLRSKFIARIWPWPHAYGSHTVPFWPLFPLQVSTLSHKSENWSHQNLALPYYILPPPVLACTTNICSIVVQFFLAFCTYSYFTYSAVQRNVFQGYVEEMKRTWSLFSASHITIPVFRVFLILQLGASFDSPLIQMHIHTHHIWLQLYKYCLFPFFSWTLLSHFFIMVVLPVTNLNWIVKSMVFCNQIHYPTPHPLPQYS